MSEFRTAPMKDGIRYNSKGEPIVDRACGNCPHPQSHHYFGDNLGADGRMHAWCQVRECGCKDYRPPLVPQP